VLLGRFASLSLLLHGRKRQNRILCPILSDGVAARGSGKSGNTAANTTIIGKAGSATTVDGNSNSPPYPLRVPEAKIIELLPVFQKE
jgi:hypothetical protein